MSKGLLSFVETENQLMEILSLRENISEDLQIILVTPEAVYAAERRQLKLPTIEDFCSIEELNRYGDQNIEITERLSDELDILLHTVAGQHLRNEWVSVKGFFHYLKSFIDCMSFRMVPVLEVFRRIQPSVLVCPKLEPYTVKSLYLFDKPIYSLTQHIAQRVAENQGCKVISISASGIEKGVGKNCSNPEGCFLGFQNLSAYFRKVLVLVLCRIRDCKRHLSRFVASDETCLLISISEDLGTEILDVWRSDRMGDFVNVSTLFPARLVKPYRLAAEQTVRELWLLIKETPSIREYFRYEGVDFFVVAEDFLKHMVLVDIADLLACAPVVESQFKFRFKRGTVILTGGMVGRNYLMAKAAAEVQIPVVSCHYGGFMGYVYLPMNERYDLAEADYFICGGNGSVATLKLPSPWTFWRHGVKRAKPVAFGLPWVDKVMRKERAGRATSAVTSRGRLDKNHKHTIMYVASNMVGDNHYLGYIFPLDIWLWRLQQNIVRIAGEYPFVRLLFKPPLIARYPQPRNPLFDWLNREGPANVEVMRDVPLQDVLGEADAFVLDSPSTPLLYLAATNKPFIVYADRNIYRFVSDAASLLRKRAILCETEEDFYINYRSFLNVVELWTREEPVNDEFLHAYATYSQAGGSAIRTACFLNDLVCEGLRRQKSKTRTSTTIEESSNKLFHS